MCDLAYGSPSSTLGPGWVPPISRKTTFIETLYLRFEILLPSFWEPFGQLLYMGSQRGVWFDSFLQEMVGHLPESCPEWGTEFHGHVILDSFHDVHSPHKSALWRFHEVSQCGAGPCHDQLLRLTGVTVLGFTKGECPIHFLFDWGRAGVHRVTHTADPRVADLSCWGWLKRHNS